MKINPFNPTAENPWVVASLSSLDEARTAKKQGANAIEFRCDLAINDEKNPIEILKNIRKTIDLPILGTIRQSGDGGSFNGDESKRMALFKEITAYTDAIDIEIDSDIREEITSFARSKGIKIISSYHNFSSTEKEGDILQRIEDAKSAGGDIIKLAYMNGEKNDLLLLLKILKEYVRTNSVPMTMIGMGTVGTATRLILPCFGSCITYGHIGGAPLGAPGQIAIEILRRYIDKMKPKFRTGSMNSDEEILASVLDYK